MAVARPARGLGPGSAGRHQETGDPFPVAGVPPAAARPTDPTGAVVADGHLRRCTFRRLDPVRVGGRGPAAYYLVTCLYAGAAAALPLGDLAAAQPICGACRAPGIFRPDEG